MSSPDELTMPCDQASQRRMLFLEQMRRVPGAIAIVACASGSERTGMAATAWNSLCADPPMLLACINRTASAHDLILQAKAFSINLVRATDDETVAIFSAKRGLAGRDRFLPGQWSDGPKGQPMLQSAIVSFECSLEANHTHSTHSIFIGRVGEMRQGNEGDPLVYMNGGYVRIAGPA